MKKKEIFAAGIIKENPNLVVLLGMCPTLAVTSRMDNAIGMALAFTIVLIICNVLISLIKKLVPNEIRIPVYIVVIAAVVSVVEMFLHAYAVSIYESLGLFLSLIVVNCVILGRAEAFASKNSILDSAIDGLAQGIGYSITLLIVAFFREFLATGGIIISNPINAQQIFNIKLPASLSEVVAISSFGDAVGAFLTLGFIIAVVQNVKVRKEEKAKAKAAASKEVAK